LRRLTRSCGVCGKAVAVPVGVDVMMATNLAQARSHEAAAYCEACNASYCFDHIVWKPAPIGETMTNVALCPRCGEIMAGLPASSSA